MALTYNQISAITEKKFIPKLYDNIFDSGPILKRSQSKGWYNKIDGGERIVVPLAYAQTTAGGWYSGADTLDTTDNEQITAAEYLWKQLYVNITVTSLDEKKNSGGTRILDFVKEKTKLAEKTMKDLLSTGVYSDGSTPKQIVGLRDIVATDQTVGGIDQSANSWWQGQVDSSTTTLTIAAMRNILSLCTVDAEKPTVIAATRSNFDRYHALLQPQERFQDKDTANGGFANLLFAGVPIVVDSKCPSGHMFFINEDHIAFKVHQDEDMKFEPFQKPNNQNVKTAKIYWMGAFTSSNNRLHGKLSAITA